MPKVRVRMLPHEIDVPDDEVEVLRRGGLLVEEPPARQQPGPPEGTVKPGKNKEN